MTWREDLRRVRIGNRNLVGASFRGVAFFVDSSDRGGGRRTVVHEFPLRDDPFVEDLGRRARTFRVDGYVLGDDYLVQRDTLLAALEDTSGPGELVHPYHGVRRAICVTCSVRESRTEGGYAAFTIEFAETPTQVPVPTVVVDAAGVVATAATAADAATDAELVEKYVVTGLPSHSFASAQTALTNAAAGLKAQLAPVISATQEAAQLTGQVALITAQASSLVRTPSLILGMFRTAMTSLITTILASPGNVMNALIAAYSTNLGAVVMATTPAGTTELANQTALTSGLRRAFAVEAARLAPLVPYASNDDALAAQAQVVAMLDAEAGVAGNTAYPAIVDLRSQVLASVPGTSNFALITTVTRSVPIPSLLLAYQLYGEVDLELDLVARNHIRHPGFVSGTLNVISDV